MATVTTLLQHSNPTPALRFLGLLLKTDLVS